MGHFMTAPNQARGTFLAGRDAQLAGRIAVALAGFFFSTVADAQDGSSADLWRDATTPGATSTYGQNCVRVLGSSVCRSSEGTSISLGTEFGPQVTASRDNAGRWSIGAGAEFAPSFAGQGVAISGVRYAGSGNTEVCAGPTVGLEPIISVSPQMCTSVDRARAQEMRDAIASSQQAQRGVPAAASGSGFTDQARQDAYQAYQQMLTMVRNDPNVYNNPFAVSGGSAPASAGQQIPMPPMPNPPAGLPINGSNGMSLDQFRASVNQSMQQFRQADAQIRQGQAGTGLPATSSNQSSNGQLVFDENAPRNPYVTQNPQVYAPRNGYDAQGYRQDSPRNQYDAQGYRQDSPRNQYDAQGYRQDSPRNQYDAQGYRQDSPRNQYDAQGYRQDSPRNQYDAQGYRANSTRPSSAPTQGTANGFGYDPNGARSAVSGPSSQPSAVPVIPNVSQRAYGARSQTAALEFPAE